MIQIKAKFFRGLEIVRYACNDDLLPFNGIVHDELLVAVNVHLVPVGHALMDRCVRRHGALGRFRSRKLPGKLVNGRLLGNRSHVLGHLLPSSVKLYHGGVLGVKGRNEKLHLGFEHLEPFRHGNELPAPILCLFAHLLLQSKADPRLALIRL